MSLNHLALPYQPLWFSYFRKYQYFTCYKAGEI